MRSFFVCPRFFRLYFSILFIFPAFSFHERAENNGAAVVGHWPTTTTTVEKPGGNLTVSYSIKVSTKRGNAGKGETYNGGIQTLFISEGMVRLRLVSLMRTQSIFILPNNDPGQTTAIVKESGKTKYKYYLNTKDWDLYNQTYKDATCQFNAETTTLLNYPCKKATITLKGGRTMTLYYTEAIRDAGLSAAEPVFSCIPGLVLRYEYAYKKGIITYTATHVDRAPINPDVFKVPSRGYTVREYSPTPPAKTGKH